MYLHLGMNTVITTDSIIGIFDMDTSTVSKKTRDFLTQKEKEKKCITVSYELPGSFILCDERKEERVYISQLSTSTLYKRAEQKALSKKH